MVDRSVGPPSCRDLKERALQGDVASSIDARRACRKHIPGVTEVWHAIYSNDSAAIERIADIQVTHPAPVALGSQTYSETVPRDSRGSGPHGQCDEQDRGSEPDPNDQVSCHSPGAAFAGFGHLTRSLGEC